MTKYERRFQLTQTVLGAMLSSPNPPNIVGRSNLLQFISRVMEIVDATADQLDESRHPCVMCGEHVCKCPGGVRTPMPFERP